MSIKTKLCEECGKPLFRLTWLKKLWASWNPIDFCSVNCCQINMDRNISEVFSEYRKLRLIRGGKK